MSEFDTTATVTFEPDTASIRDTKQQFEAGIGAVEVGFEDASDVAQELAVAGQALTAGAEDLEAAAGVISDDVADEIQVEAEATVAQPMADGGAGPTAQLAQQRNEYLEAIVDHVEEIEDAVDGGFGSGGGGGGGGLLGFLGGGGRAAGAVAGSAAGGAAGGSIGLSALGVGAGVGLAGAGIGAAGLGVGTGVGLARGETDLPDEFVIEGPELSLAENFDPTFDFDPQFGPEDFDFDPTIGDDAFQFNPTFTPEVFDIDTQLAIGDNSFRFEPTLGSGKFDFDPTIEKGAFQFGPKDFDLSPEIDIGDVTIDPELAFNPTINISPSLSITGVDISGIGDEAVDEIVNSRTFQNELESELSDQIDDFERRLTRAFGGRP
jgi:hypothetical protein